MAREGGTQMARQTAELAERVGKVETNAAEFERKVAAVSALESRVEGRMQALAQEGAQTQQRLIAIDQQLRTTAEGLASRVNALTNRPPPAVSMPSARSQSNTEPAAEGSYRIKSGDTIEKIAKAHGTTIDAVMNANPGLNPTRLRIDQQIRLP
jgi:LysM repeat protein